jgi:hypothetical protein
MKIALVVICFFLSISLVVNYNLIKHDGELSDFHNKTMDYYYNKALDTEKELERKDRIIQYYKECLSAK